MNVSSPQMSAESAIEILSWFEINSFPVVVDGGWGVDALLGEQTRPHDDLDIAVQHSDVAGIRAMLEQRGFTDVPRNDTWECNFVLGDALGRQVDIHSCTFNEKHENIFGVAYPYDSLQGHGSISGHPVRCIPPDWMVRFHTGYPLDENDYLDTKHLCQRFSLPLPEDYAEFVARDKSL